MPNEHGYRHGDHAREDGGQPRGDAKDGEHQDQRYERNQRREDGQPEMSRGIERLLKHGGRGVRHEFCYIEPRTRKSWTSIPHIRVAAVNGELLGGASIDVCS